MIRSTTDDRHYVTGSENERGDGAGASNSSRPYTPIEEGEPLLSVAEVAVRFRVSYDSARRYFKDLPGVLVFFHPRRYKRPYRIYKIPRSVFQREWQRLATVNGSKPR
jgi:hypothetical protein